MSVRYWLLCFALVGAAQLAPAAEPPPGPAPPVDQQFAQYRHDVSTTADDLLLAAQTPPPPAAVEPEPVKDTATAKRGQFERLAHDYWGGRDENLRRTLERLERLQPELTSILRAEGVPADLAAVVLVESGAWPTAESPRGARGLWQFIPETARRYGLEVTPTRDDRLDMEKSTRAAARYLRDLYERFGSWPLALAAYNAGEATVQNAIDRAGSVEFNRLSRERLLPAETRGYVPAVLAAMELLEGNVFANAKVESTHILLANTR